MNRLVLASENIAPAALKFITNNYINVVNEVASAVKDNKVVVVGMAANPYVMKARKALSKEGIDFKYLEYGGYMSMWQQRLAIKLWSGWATYPQVFVAGKLIGGFKELEATLKAGHLQK